jgi:hypothetical protein
MRSGTARYYLRRLRHLQWPELSRRFRLWRQRQVERRQSRLDPEAMSVERVFSRRNQWLLPEAVSDPAMAAYDSLQAAYPSSSWLVPDFWRGFAQLYPDEVKQLVDRAESILAGRFLLFQWKHLELSMPPSWSSALTPNQPGEAWPDIYYGDLAFGHDPRHPELDVRWCWELNRFQHLLWLGAAWRLTGDERFPRVARGQLENWLEIERYPWGVHWSSNLEVGLRALSWMRCHVLCLNSRDWDSVFVNRLLSGLVIHAAHLEKELSLHHPHGNHLLGEAAALFCLSLAYPFFTDAGRWRETACFILNRIVPHLILPDGVYAEQSTGYFKFVCEFLFPVLEAAKHHGIPLSPLISERLYAGLQWIGSLSPADTETPMIGDADTGTAIGWRLADYWDSTPLMAAGAVMAKRPGLAKGIGSFPAESYLLLGNEARNAFGEMAGQCRRACPKSPSDCHPGASRGPVEAGQTWIPASAGITGKVSFDLLGHALKEEAEEPLLQLRHFPHGGYQVSQSPEFFVVFDVGPLGLPPAYAHGHSDGLSFLLFHRGRRILLDPGTGLYNGPLEWREYFPSAAAHNTLTVAGAGPIERLDTFRWADALQIEARPPLKGSNWHLLQGSVRWRRFVHTRRILHVDGEGLIILDGVKGGGEYDLEFTFHFDPRWEIEHASERHPATLFASCGLDLVFGSLSPVILTILKGSTSPMAGWYSPYYGNRIPSPSVIVRQRAMLPAYLVTIIKPYGSRVTIPGDVPNDRIPRGLLTPFLQ